MKMASVITSGTAAAAARCLGGNFSSRSATNLRSRLAVSSVRTAASALPTNPAVMVGRQ
jgi:hypothetical protein